MLEDLKPWASLPAPELPADLLDRLLLRIRTMRARQLRTRLVLALTGAVLSLVYVGLNLSVLVGEFQQSSFFEMLRLAFTDSDVVFAHLQDVTLGMLETLPVESIFFGAVLALLAFLSIGFIYNLRGLKHSAILNHSI